VLFDATVDGRTVRVEVREVRGKDGHYTVVLDGQPLDVDLHEAGRDFVSLIIGGRSYEAGLEKQPGGYMVVLPDDAVAVELVDAARGSPGGARRGPAGPARLTAPMPGKVVRVLAAAGQEVVAGQGVVVIEAMKMENELRAPRDGRIADLQVREGQAVETGALIAVVE
jgi:biotin carboxyl carrier protein